MHSFLFTLSAHYLSLFCSYLVAFFYAARFLPILRTCPPILIMQVIDHPKPILFLPALFLLITRASFLSHHLILPPFFVRFSLLTFPQGLGNVGWSEDLFRM